MLEEVPSAAGERLTWLSTQRRPQNERFADTYRQRLIEIYGEERGSRVKTAEVFTASPVSHALTPENMHEYFPFLLKE
jgi:hypothetical protein